MSNATSVLYTTRVAMDFQDWETDTLYEMDGTYFVSPDGIGRIFEDEHNTLEELEDMLPENFDTVHINFI